jgi:hypothetical protein
MSVTVKRQMNEINPSCTFLHVRGLETHNPNTSVLLILKDVRNMENTQMERPLICLDFVLDRWICKYTYFVVPKGTEIIFCDETTISSAVYSGGSILVWSSNVWLRECLAEEYTVPRHIIRKRWHVYKTIHYSVDLARGYRLYRLGFGIRFLVGVKVSLFFVGPKEALGPTDLPIQLMLESPS